MHSAGRVSDELRRELAAAAFRLTAGYDEHIAAELAARWWGRAPYRPGATQPSPDRPPASELSPRQATPEPGQATPEPGQGTVAPENGTAQPDTAQSLPEQLTVNLERLDVLRYGENPHQRAALYRAAGIELAAGPFNHGPLLLQGKPLSHNNILDAAAAAGLARDLRGPACVIVKHANPCGAAEADSLLMAWQQALAGDPVSA